jgi:NADPH:quinone reductase
MRAVTYTRPGDPSVLELVERPTPEPGAGEIRIRLLVSGVNPTDWKARSGATGCRVTTSSTFGGFGLVGRGRRSR